jgi:3-hydroxyacyl-CoA dehydrogenase
MPNGINHVTVIGAGTMGAAIAGHLANAGVPVSLLDIVPTELTSEESAAGLTLESPSVRNRFAQQGFARMVKARPGNLFTRDTAQLIRVGNLEDDFEAAVGKSDWIIEVIVERPGPKQALMARIEAAAPATAIISSNTSGIPIHIISEGRSEDFKKRFLGTHFFNPPRYLHLLELIPTPATDPAIVQRMRQFAETALGKGVVICKDTPNFIANRMFSFVQSDLMEFAIENGYTVEEVDKLTGPLLGRPKTGTFRLNDVVGIDVLAMVSQNLYELIPNDEDREVLRGEYGSALIQALLDAKLLGSKSGQGFYKTVTDAKGKKEFHGLDLQAAAEGEIEYVAPRKPKWSSVGEAKDLPLEERLRSLVNAADPAGELVWHTLARTMAYASKRIPEIADSLVDIDNAMKWGFGWEMGPFETWDALGVKETTSRMVGEGITVAPWVDEFLAAGNESFYCYENGKRQVYNPLEKGYGPAAPDPRMITLAAIRHRSRPLAENDSAVLHDMGDGVLLFEARSKLNVFEQGSFEILQKAVERLHGGAAGLVLGNEGSDYSAGANLLQVAILVQSGDWEGVEKFLKFGQETFMALRTAPKPVVAAPHQRVLGGGVESCLASDRIVAHAETYMGLVEVGVGIVPGWGGCKEMVRRNVSPHMHATNVNPMPYLRQVFETIGFAKIAESAAQARELGFLDESDLIVMNRDFQLAEAKRAVLEMAADGYRPPVTTGNVYAAGRSMLASVKIEVYSMEQGGYISAHDGVIANRLGHVLCGGALSEPAWMDEQYFLDLEREATLSLAGMPKTQERVMYMLQAGKPLRN